jgi:hypothetical protein
MNEIENRDNWLNELVTEIKLIEEKWKIDTLKRYRQCGKLILESGYGQKSKWSSKIFNDFMELTGYKKTAIYEMIRLGKLTDREFSDISEIFPSLYAFTHSKALGSAISKHKPESSMKHLEIPANRFKNGREAMEFFKSFDGEYEGLFYHGNVNREVWERNQVIKQVGQLEVFTE